MALSSAYRATTLSILSESFVDDTNLGATATQSDWDLTQQTTLDREASVIHFLQELAKEWERILYSAGGVFNLQKCSWFLISWVWKNVRAKLTNEKESPDNLSLLGNNLQNPVSIRRLDPHDSFRTLGVHILPSRSNSGALTVLQQISLDYATQIVSSNFTWEDALWSYILYFLPKIRF